MENKVDGRCHFKKLKRILFMMIFTIKDHYTDVNVKKRFLVMKSKF